MSGEAWKELGGPGHLPPRGPSPLVGSQLDAQGPAPARAIADSVPSDQLSTLAHVLPVGLLKLFVGIRPQTTPPTRGFHDCGL